MRSNKQSQSIPGFQPGKPEMNLLELAGAPMMPEGVKRDSTGDLQRSHEQLCELLSDLRARNKELESLRSHARP